MRRPLFERVTSRSGQSTSRQPLLMSRSTHDLEATYSRWHGALRNCYRAGQLSKHGEGFMANTVGVNGLSVVTKDSNGITVAFPDVCKTPSPGGPVPIPYPNIARSADTDKGSKKVTVEGNPVCLKDSCFSTSTGDEAGTAGGGVASNKTKGKAEFVNYSVDVKFEGKNVARALDPMFHNDKNTPPTPLIQGPVIAIGKPPGKPVCLNCEQEF